VVDPGRLALGPHDVIWTIAHFVAAVLLTCSLVMLYRWVGLRSAALARLFATGLIVRAVFGVALFFISFFGWPFFRSLQLGGGFWTLALDGRSYYEAAANAAVHSLASISDTFPSPMYMRTLAVWMRIFGISPASALLLNVAVYAACVPLILMTAGIGDRAEPRETTGAIVTVAALTFSPALLVFGTQPLKDSLCVLLIIATICGARVMYAADSAQNRSPAVNIAIGTLLMTVGVYGLAGIRPYVCILIMVAVAAAAGARLLTNVSLKRRLRDALRDGVLVAVLWIVFVSGAGPYAQPYQSAILSVFSSPRAPVKAFDSARAGFTASGGATLIETPSGGVLGEKAEVAEPTPPLSRSVAARIGRLVRGLLVFLVPVSALAAASIVTFSGGQGLLVVTDLDTIAIDLTVAFSLGLLILSLKRDRLTSATLFALVLGFLLTVSMSYVVTNYGTLFRLRLMGVTPLWMVPVLLPWRRQDASGLRVP
jgi:hypothetical protein